MEWTSLQANVGRFVMPVLVVLGWYIADRVLVKLAGRLFDGGISRVRNGTTVQLDDHERRRGSRGSGRSKAWSSTS